VTVDQILIALRRAAQNDYSLSVSPYEAAALVVEVELLRENVATLSDDFQRVTSEVCAPDEVHCSCVPYLRTAVDVAHAEAIEMRAWAEEAAKAENENAEDARRERVAVVAWLRAEAYLTLYEATPEDVADCIERGEHRRGESAP